MRRGLPFFAMLPEIWMMSESRPLAETTIDQLRPAISHARKPALKLNKMIAWLRWACR